MAASDSAIKTSTATARTSGVGVTLLVIAAAGAAIVGFGLLFSLWLGSGPPDAYETLRIASREFVNGRSILAGEIAERVELDPEATDFPQWNALQLFLLSAASVARADDADDDRQTRMLLHDAVPQLQQSAIAGYPVGRQSEGQRLLGVTLYRIGRFDEAAAELRSAIDRDPTMARELIPLLANSDLRSTKPHPERALATINQLLQNASLDAVQLHAAQSIKIRSLVQLGQWSEAIEIIEDTISQLEAEPTQLLGERVDRRDEMRLLRSVVDIQRAIDQFGSSGSKVPNQRARVTSQLMPATEWLVDIEREATPTIASQARLWAARAFRCQGEQNLALTRLTAVRQQRPFGAESIAAGLEEIELLAEQGRGLEVLQTVRYVVRELGDPRGFDSSLVSFADFRRRLGEAIEQLRRAGEFQPAIDVARSLPPLFDASESLLQEAASYTQWAEATLRDSTNAAGDLSRAAASQARSYFRASGDAYSAAATLDFDTPRYLDTLWSAIDAYQKGRHFARSVELLQPYLRYEQRSRQPRGMVAIGRALLAENDAANAIKTLNDCVMEFPRDPLRYDARLLAALAYSDLGNLDAAIGLLTDNLQDGDLTPQSPAWRDSLFTLGDVTFNRAFAADLEVKQARPETRLTLLRENQPRIKMAIRYLNESVERYWPSEQAQRAAYQRTCAHRLAANLPRAEAMSPDIPDAATRTYRAQADSELELARDGFESLSKFLLAADEESQLPDVRQSLLRNCLLGEADVLRSLKRIDEAIVAYRAISIRFMNEPAALEALLGQARCAKDLGQQRESEGLVRQAAIVLERIPQELDDQFAATTRYDRAGWKKWLTWMTNRFDTANNNA